MGPSQTSEAIVLRTRPYGESDKIVTFLSRDFGKLTGIAKGARNSRRRFANCLDTFTSVRVHFRIRVGASLVFMDSCDLLSPPGALGDPKKLAYASYLSELVDQLVGEGHPVPEIFQLFRDALQELRERPAAAAFLRVFELQLLLHAGYDPQLSTCSRCQRSLLEDETVYFDALQTNIVCAICRASNERLQSFHGQSVRMLNELKDVSLQVAQTRRLGPVFAAEATQLLGYLLAPHLPRPLRSIKLIAALA